MNDGPMPGSPHLLTKWIPGLHAICDVVVARARVRLRIQAAAAGKLHTIEGPSDDWPRGGAL